MWKEKEEDLRLRFSEDTGTTTAVTTTSITSLFFFVFFRCSRVKKRGEDKGGEGEDSGERAKVLSSDSSRKELSESSSEGGEGGASGDTKCPEASGVCTPGA